MDGKTTLITVGNISFFSTNGATDLAGRNLCGILVEKFFRHFAKEISEKVGNGFVVHNLQTRIFTSHENATAKIRKDEISANASRNFSNENPVLPISTDLILRNVHELFRLFHKYSVLQVTVITLKKKSIEKKKNSNQNPFVEKNGGMLNDHFLGQIPGDDASRVADDFTSSNVPFAAFANLHATRSEPFDLGVSDPRATACITNCVSVFAI
jgi:hypothetical protein